MYQTIHVVSTYLDLGCMLTLTSFANVPQVLSISKLSLVNWESKFFQNDFSLIQGAAFDQDNVVQIVYRCSLLLRSSVIGDLPTVPSRM